MCKGVDATYGEIIIGKQVVTVNAFFNRVNEERLDLRGLGTREGHLWYGICVPCAKRLPGVRDAFSEALGAKNRLLVYRMEIRC